MTTWRSWTNPFLITGYRSRVVEMEPDRGRREMPWRGSSAASYAPRDTLPVTAPDDAQGVIEFPKPAATATAAIRLTVPALPGGVEVSVRARSGRWIAKATWASGAQAGIGATPRDALVAALSPLGKQAIVELLASPDAFALSVQLAAGELAQRAR